MVFRPCQPGDLSDSFTASHGRGSDWGFLLVHFYVVHPVSWVGEKAVLPRAGPAEEGKEMTMPTNVDDIIRKLSPAQRKKVEARAAQLIAEEMTLRELRHARKLTQVRLAKALGITQDSVSRLEKRSDLLLSTLRKTVVAMGGNLSLIAEFPDRAPVVLSGIAEDDPRPKPTGRKNAHSHA
jgi:DNA-binding XRE family transcriptional regulator